MLQLFSFTESNFNIKDLKKKMNRLFRDKNMLLHEKFKIGKSRIDTIFINIILPITYLYAQKMSYQKLKNIVFKIYNEYPSLPKNNKISKMYQFIDDGQKKMSRESANLQQGLLEIFSEFCQYHQCDLCMRKKSDILNKEYDEL